MKQEILHFFKTLDAAQEKTLAVLQKKQSALVKPEPENLRLVSVEENEAVDLLRQALEEREAVLAAARQRGWDCDSIQTVCERAFPGQNEWKQVIEKLQAQSTQIRFVSLTNWTMSQKSLVHVTQILEFIETRGEGKTTYQFPKGTRTASNGGFVDKVA